MKEVQIKINSDIGPLYLIASDIGIKSLNFISNPKYIISNKEQIEPKIKKNLKNAEKQLQEYFAGKRQTFHLALDLEGTTFQKKVWAQLLKIPFGQTKSYKDIAVRIKDINASRAVGTANGKNPICIIIPCHRVITSNGSLGGYSGGTEIKKKLLSIENISFS